MNKLKLLQQEYKAIKADYESALQLVDNYMESTGIDFYDDKYDEIEMFKRIEFNVYDLYNQLNIVADKLINESEKYLLHKDIKELIQIAKKNITVRNKVLNLIINLWGVDKICWQLKEKKKLIWLLKNI